MSVYTNVSAYELNEFLGRYSLGQLQQFVGISDGIENTNYFVTTSKGQYVLTIFEQLTSEELPYFLKLMAFYAEAGIPTAHPISDNQNQYINILNSKSAALVKRLNGVSVGIANTKQCQQVGVQMARMHVSSEKFSMSRKPSRNKEWRNQTAKLVMPKLNKEEQILLQRELDYLETKNFNDLHMSVIHADLFRDNVLFIGDEITGIIDFYYAYNGFSIYDLAVAINDWCITGKKDRDKENTKALLSAYQTTRTIKNNERDSWCYFLRLAALRFWLSRLRDKYFPRGGEITHIKDPDRFKAIVQERSENEEEIMSIWDSC
tara:strand:+ start:2046 stop:3002 length:957 start_codon:yes stop_codon:yes gene_type:complete